MGEPAEILLVEDDPQISRFLLTALGAAAFRPRHARTAADGHRLFAEHKPQLVVLDLGLPDGEGSDFIREVRGRSDVPILVLSARQSEVEKVRCLDLGADDYLAKPFGVDELLARIRVALRRVQLMVMRDHAYAVGGLSIDMAGGQVALDGVAVHLSPIEHKLLMLLAQHPGRICTHRQLLTEVWGAEYIDDTHYLRIHMGRLRAKLESEPGRPRYILTELGIGYRLAAQ